jgi:hypothetical protein
MPLTLSTERSIKLATTMMRSKMFHPLEKYSLLMASNLSRASRVKKAVKTWKKYQKTF